LYKQIKDYLIEDITTGGNKKGGTKPTLKKNLTNALSPKVPEAKKY
jgi:hypothetical protein